VRDAGIGPRDLVLDLGAGNGRLTGPLARVARRVVAVELDQRLAASLRGRWSNVEVVEGDAAAIALPREPFRVVSNIPFSRTADLLHALLDDPSVLLVRADLVVEWGVAFKRAVPWPSTVSGVVWGATYETHLARRLPRTAFDPPPDTDAAVIVFTRRDRPLVPLERVTDYQRFVARGFRHGLRRVVPASALQGAAGSSAIARDLDAHLWAALFLRQGTSRRKGARASLP
jgi:23S rRNA (adenine-N6)-dimethyltransferase